VGSTAQEPFGEVATRQFLWSASELPVQPWPDSFGWAGYTNAILENGAAEEASTGDNAEIWNYAAGLALPDFGKEGNLLGLVAGVPPRAGRNDFELLVEMMTPLSI